MLACWTSWSGGDPGERREEISPLQLRLASCWFAAGAIPQRCPDVQLPVPVPLASVPALLLSETLVTLSELTSNPAIGSTS